ncbi:MAG: cupin domain-containing protein [Myxococcota bacterium]
MGPLMTHHPPDDLLAAHAAGAADDAEALLVATHLALCPVCRDACAALDAVGGALLGAGAVLPGDPGPAGPSVGMSADALDAALAATLGRLDAPDTDVPRPMPPADGPNDLPMPLRALTGPLSAIPFRAAAPGIWKFELPQSRPGRPVCLVSLRPGLVVPPHRHSGAERGLVLTGGFADETGHYTRGDVSFRTPDEAEPHHQRIDDGERCVVLMVDDGPKIPTTWLGRVVNFLFGM